MAAAAGRRAAPRRSGDDPSLALRAEAQRQPQPLWRAGWPAMAEQRHRVARRRRAPAGRRGLQRRGGPARSVQHAVNGRLSVRARQLDETSARRLRQAVRAGRAARRLLQHPAAALRRHHRQGLEGAAGRRRRRRRSRRRTSRSSSAPPSIRDLFFAGGAHDAARSASTSRPSPRFRRDAGDASISTAPTITYAHGPPRATQVTWPGPNRMTTCAWCSTRRRPAAPARCRRPARGRCSACSATARCSRAGSPERYTLTFTLGDRQASFELRAGSVHEPVRTRRAAGLPLSAVQ